MSVSMTGISMPNFVMAPLLVLVFAVHLGWLPAGGSGGGLDPEHGAARDRARVAADRLSRAAHARQHDRGPAQQLRPHGEGARACRAGRSCLRHALKPALLPVVSYLGPRRRRVITGSVVIEQIFGVPGLGRYFVTGALNRDYTLVMGVVVFYGVLIIASTCSSTSRTRGSIRR